MQIISHHDLTGFDTSSNNREVEASGKSAFRGNKKMPSLVNGFTRKKIKKGG